MKSTRTGFVTERLERKGILILGHRGCRKSDVFENTLPAFQKAFAAGADGIEIDVETASDGKLVVINRWFAHKTFGFYPWERDSSALRARGIKIGLAIPSFEDVCELVRSRHEFLLNVEIKSSDRFLCRTAKQVGRLVNRFGIEHRVIVSSFDVNALFTMKIRHPGIETAYLFRTEDRVTDLADKGTLKYRVNGFVNRSGIKAAVLGVDALHPEIKLIDDSRTPAWQKYAELAGKRISCWPVDSEDNFRKAIRIGADIVIADHPEQTVTYRSRLKSTIGS